MLPVLMHQMHILTTNVFSVMLWPKKVGNPKKLFNCERAGKKYNAMKLSQIR
jgi:hypothetical protein